MQVQAGSDPRLVCLSGRVPRNHNSRSTRYTYSCPHTLTWNQWSLGILGGVGFEVWAVGGNRAPVVTMMCGIFAPGFVPT